MKMSAGMLGEATHGNSDEAEAGQQFASMLSEPRRTHQGPVLDVHGVASGRHFDTFTLHLQVQLSVSDPSPCCVAG